MVIIVRQYPVFGHLPTIMTILDSGIKHQKSGGVPTMKRTCTTGLAILGLLLTFGSGWAQTTEDNPDRPPGIQIADLNRQRPVDFKTEVLPILKQSCLACHNTTKNKAGLVLETPKSILKGSEYGPVIVPGRGAESQLLQLAAHTEDPMMPPKGNRVNAPNLSPQQLGLLKLWIDQGADGQGDGEVAAPIAWDGIPEGLNPIYAVAVSPDGQYVSCGRANQIFVYHIPSRQLVARLKDPQTGVAHRDLVHSLAFGPKDRTLASGGYRTVKLWNQPRNVQKWKLSAAATDSTDDKDAADSPAGPGPSVAASLDGKWIATIDQEAILIWDAHTGTMATKLTGHTSSVSSVIFSRDGSRLYSGATDKTVRAWNVSDGGLLATAETDATVDSVTWTSGSADLVTGGGDNIIRVWKLAQGEADTFVLTEVRQISGHSMAISCLDTFSSDSQRIVSGSADGSVRVWNVETAEQIRQFDHGPSVTAVAIRPDGKRIVSGGTNNLALVWNAENGERVAELKGDRYAHELEKATERTVNFTTSQLKLWDDNLTEAEKTQKSSAETMIKVGDKRPEAHKLASEKQAELDKGEQAKVDAEKTLANAKQKTADAEAKKKDAQLAVERADQLATRMAAMVIDLQKKAELSAAKAKEAQASALLVEAELDRLRIEAKAKADEASSQNEEQVTQKQKDPHEAQAEVEKTAALLADKQKDVDASSAATEQATKDVTDQQQLATDSLTIKEVTVQFLAESEKKLQAASSQQEKAAKDLKTTEEAIDNLKKELKKAERARDAAENKYYQSTLTLRRQVKSTLDNHSNAGRARRDHEQATAELASARKAAEAMTQPILAIAFSLDNQLLATAGNSKVVYTFNADNGSAYESYEGHKTSVSGLAFTPEGALVSAATDGTAIVWDLSPAWTLSHVLGGDGDASAFDDRVLALAFDPEGKYLATGSGQPSRDGKVKLWHARDGQFVREFKNAHSDTVFGLEFSPEGQYLASAAADKFVKVFDVSSGKLAKSFEGHTHHVLDVSWNRNRRVLASSGADKAIKVWDFVTGERKRTNSSFAKEVTSIRYIGYTDQTLVSAGDPKVSILRENGDSVRTFDGPESYMFCSDVTPDGATIVAGGQDGILRVWDGSGTQIASFAPLKVDAPEDQKSVVRRGESETRTKKPES